MNAIKQNIIKARLSAKRPANFLVSVEHAHSQHRRFASSVPPHVLQYGD